jgi:hypothetical protein
MSSNNQKIFINIIQGNKFFFGNVIRETTKGYYVTWPSSPESLGNPVGEWFAKDSALVTCKLVE